MFFELTNPNFFDEHEINQIDFILSNFYVDEQPFVDEKGTNDYFRKYVEIEHLKNYKSKLENFIYNKFNCSVVLSNYWINQVKPETNKKDNFHKDKSDFTAITFLNDNYEGGEFEYIDTKTGEKVKVKPKKFNVLFMNNNLQHRVLPVKKGARYSLISFMKYNDKKIKSIL